MYVGWGKRWIKGPGGLLAEDPHTTLLPHGLSFQGGDWDWIRWLAMWWMKRRRMAKIHRSTSTTYARAYVPEGHRHGDSWIITVVKPYWWWSAAVWILYNEWENHEALTFRNLAPTPQSLLLAAVTYPWASQATSILAPVQRTEWGACSVPNEGNHPARWGPERATRWPYVRT